MRIHDGLSGALLLVLSLAVLWHIQSFPPAAGQPYGPALFPGLIASGLALSSLALIWQSRKTPGPWLAAGPGLRSPRHVRGFVAALAGMVFYILCADALGFIVASIVVLVGLQWALGVRIGVALPVALVTTLVIHTCFYKLLRVPLPWGILQPFAW